ncbi:adenylyl-sulfate kinase [Geobacillus zalihae]|uniref:adenylyl-sulfate kinase n=1 Tax=Geobacillus zalihae TaxID=213419 RepID=UPI001CC219D7|nr:adenylyl-sulfate kinase [Geobacillus zalihae]
MELRDRIDFLCKTILAIKTAGRLVLGIDGLSRSGKTTLANQLSQTLREQGISMNGLHS